jgi:cystathionine gamma-synthase
VGYEEGEECVIGSMTTGYPRFFVHRSIQTLVAEILRRFGSSDEAATLFPSPKTAARCYDFVVSKVPYDEARKVRVVNLVMPRQVATGGCGHCQPANVMPKLSCVLYPKTHSRIAKQVWQHSGEGISSRRSEFYLMALEDGYLVEESRCHSEVAKVQRLHKGPKRYQNNGSLGTRDPVLRRSRIPLTVSKGVLEGKEFNQFIEERFGRNLGTALARNAKLAVKRRIAGSLTADVDLTEALETTPCHGRVAGLTEDDVFLYPSGMSSIFNTHQILMTTRGPMKSICYGFPYIDTLKILEKWGPGVLFYGHASSEELDDLEQRLQLGEKFLALFTEFPGNPLLMSPDIQRIRSMATKYDFAVVVDESVGNFINVNALPYVDIVVSSLTKIFSGDSNVMAGSAAYNPHGQYYRALKRVLAREYEDNLWVEDAIFLERNSRDFMSRIQRINATTEAITEQLKASPLSKAYPGILYSPFSADTR